MDDEIRIVDTTLRDGNTSLWAHNMTTGMMHPVLRHMDRAGFDAMEFFVSGRFKKVVREQRDDPWDWVRYGQKEIKNTQLRYHGGMNSGFTLTPRCIPRLIIERVVHYGITVTRLSDPWNDYKVLSKEVADLKAWAWNRWSISSIRSRRAIPTNTTRAKRAKPPPETLSALLQRCRRDAHAGARSYPGAFDSRQRRRRAGGIPRALQQRSRAV